MNVTRVLFAVIAFTIVLTAFFLPWIEIFGYGLSLYNMLTGVRVGNKTFSYSTVPSSMSQHGLSQISYLLYISIALYALSLIGLIAGIFSGVGLLVGGLSGIFSGLIWIYAIDSMKNMIMKYAQTGQNPFQQLGAVFATMGINTGEGSCILMIGGVIGMLGFFISRSIGRRVVYQSQVSMTDN